MAAKFWSLKEGKLEHSNCESLPEVTEEHLRSTNFDMMIAPTSVNTTGVMSPMLPVPVRVKERDVGFDRTK